MLIVSRGVPRARWRLVPDPAIKLCLLKWVGNGLAVANGNTVHVDGFSALFEPDVKGRQQREAVTSCHNYINIGINCALNIAIFTIIRDAKEITATTSRAAIRPREILS